MAIDATTKRWLRCPRPNAEARLRLFCFPYSGGSASSFRTWEYAMPSFVELCLVQLPGRENRMKEEPYRHVKPLVQELAQALLPAMTIPFAFFGHSLGALVSFEVARQLRRQGCLGPQLLLVSSHRAPHISDRDPHIHALPEKDFIEQLRRFNGTPESVLQDQELMRLVLPLLRADLEIYETYTYTREAPLDCAISAFGGLEDWRVSHEDLAAWKEQTHGSFSLRMFAGDHFFLHSLQEAVLQALSQDLRHLMQTII